MGANLSDWVPHLVTAIVDRRDQRLDLQGRHRHHARYLSSNARPARRDRSGGQCLRGLTTRRLVEVVRTPTLDGLDRLLSRLMSPHAGASSNQLRVGERMLSERQVLARPSQPPSRCDVNLRRLAQDPDPHAARLARLPASSPGRRDALRRSRSRRPRQGDPTTPATLARHRHGCW